LEEGIEAEVSVNWQSLGAAQLRQWHIRNLPLASSTAHLGF